MNCIAPAGPIYQAGALSGNPFGDGAAGLCDAVIPQLKFMQKLAITTEALVSGITAVASTTYNCKENRIMRDV